MSHWYNKDGKPTGEGEGFPSVTTILDIRKNYGLNSWRDRMGAEAADAHSKISTDKGTLVHKTVEAMLRADDWEDVVEPEGISPYITGFLNWREEYQPETVSVEAFCLSEQYKYAGTVDYICRINGRLTIVDWKTSKGDATRWKKKAAAYMLQLVAYQAAWYEMTGELAGIMAVQLCDDIKRGYRVTTATPAQYGQLHHLFMCHHAIFNWAVEIGEITFEKPYVQREGLIRI